MKTYDIIIIGGGRASTLAIKAATAGKSVALIERDRLGGTCPNRGCVPSKLLIGYADVAKRIREASRHHISATIDAIDLPQIFADLNHWIESVDPRYESRFPENLTLYRGEGKFISNKVVEVNGTQLTAEQIIIGTGARSRPSAFPNLPSWTSDDIFPFNHPIPKTIAIVGGGFIACELANFFHSVGINTTLLVRGHTLLPNEDKTISSIFKEEFSHYVPTKFGTTITNASHDGQQFHLTLDESSQQTELTVDALLYATGRIPNTENLGLENTDIALNTRGFVERDQNLETAVKGVYAVGDVAGTYQLQHAASFEVNHLVNTLINTDNKSNNQIPTPMMPHAVFTDPEIASVGITEQDLDKQEFSANDVVIVETNWKSSARALSWKLDYPITKFIVKKSDYSLIGCHMIGPESSTMIHQILTLIHLDNDIRNIPNMIHIHPSLSESLIAVATEAITKIETDKPS
ncbi:MAG: dihydrolipoyl dehydrogenase family protein [Akkermansiaceae bacterium]